MRIGAGYDIHRLVEGRPFLLGGVTLPYPRGPLGHSDGDALTHAIVDALLGAAALGDIGHHFPPGDPAWRDAPGLDLLRRTLVLLQQAGYDVHNVDTTVVLEEPRLSPYVEPIRANLAEALGIQVSQVSVKAKTNEGLDAVGLKQAVAAHAVVLLLERNG